MITDVAEVRDVRELLDACAASSAAAPPLGVMIETPASALLAGCTRRGRRLSSPSAATTSRNTRWPWIAVRRSSRRSSTRCIRPYCG
jgi:hypothetical protein